MTTVTIPRNVSGSQRNQRLVAIPEELYEEFVRWHDIVRSFKVFNPTAQQRKDLAHARKDYRKKNYISLDELRQRLDGTR